MSYVVEILRPIRREEVLAIVADDVELSVLEQGDGWIDISWACGEVRAVFAFAQGRISVTTPDARAWGKAQQLARLLEASVIGEEDEIPYRVRVEPGVLEGRATWIGWPVLAIVLAALLVWKW